MKAALSLIEFAGPYAAGWAVCQWVYTDRLSWLAVGIFIGSIILAGFLRAAADRHSGASAAQDGEPG